VEADDLAELVLEMVLILLQLVLEPDEAVRLSKTGGLFLFRWAGFALLF